MSDNLRENEGESSGFQDNSFFSKFPFLRKKSVLVLLMAVIALVLIVPLIFFISSENGGSINQNPPVETTDPFDIPHIPDELIIKLKNDYTLEELENLKNVFNEIGVISQEPVFDSDDPDLKNYILLKFKPGTDLRKVKERLDQAPEIEFSGPDYEVTAFESPNDPSFSQQWNMAKIQMPQAWDLAKGDNRVVVAVIDTGVNYNHPDFSGRTIIRGRNYITGSTNPMDDMGHGSHVAGIIGAVTNNSQGIASVNWNSSVEILAVKTLDSAGNGKSADVADAIRYAADPSRGNADVINLSLGIRDPLNTSSNLCGEKTPYYQAAIDYARANNVLVVMAAGNDNVDIRNVVPASCSGGIVVGAVDRNDARSYYSNYGAGVNLAAPGGDTRGGESNGILSIWGNGYRGVQGTSMAAPHVAGVAGMLLSVKPGLSPSQIETCIVNNADSISDASLGGKRLNAAKTISVCSGLALLPTATPVPGVTVVATPTPIRATPTPSSLNRKIIGLVYADNNGNGKFDTGDPGIPNVTVAISGQASLTTTTNTSGAFVFDNLAPGTYKVEATVRGLTAQVSGTITQGTKEFGVRLGFPDWALRPTIDPSQPTPTPFVYQPTIINQPTPTKRQAPKKTYSCRQADGEIPSNAITIGSLVCTPNP